MLPNDTNSQYVIYRKAANGKKYHIRVSFDPTRNEYTAIPCPPSFDLQPIEEHYFLSQCEDSNPELAKIIMDTLDGYFKLTYRTRRRKKKKKSN